MGSSISTSCFGRTLCGACTRPEQWLWKWGMSPKCGFWIILMRSGWSCEFRGIPSFGQKLGISLNTKRTLGMCEGPRLDVRSLKNSRDRDKLVQDPSDGLYHDTMKAMQVPKTCQAAIGYIHCMIMHDIHAHHMNPSCPQKSILRVSWDWLLFGRHGSHGSCCCGGSGWSHWDYHLPNVVRRDVPFFFFYMFFFCNLIIFRLVHPPKKTGMTKSWKIRMIISANRGLAVAILLHHHVPWWFL